jgi:carotenoid cleavage dioxygenase-like enzyme
MTQLNSKETNHHNYSVVLPYSLLSASRYELSDVPLNIEGELPEDIQGHAFFVAPVGTVESGGKPYPNGDYLINGDGMIYRLDFNQLEKVNLRTKLVKPADYYADKATRPDTNYSQYGFSNHGLTRFSLSLGLRNELNTAFLPMPFSSNSPQRLLVTYDAGRPYEIDTETLETVTPVGANTEWRSEIQGQNFPFPPILSSAHPAFDGYTGEMFTVNYGRSVENFFKTIPLTWQLQELPQELEEFVTAMAGFISAELVRNVLDALYGLFDEFSDQIAQTIEAISGIELDNFVYLIRWDGHNYLERWKLVLPDGSPIKIKQTIHQIGISQDYVVLMDTAFITGVEQVLNSPFPNNQKLNTTIRDLLEKPQNPDSVIYIVRRQDLKRGQYPAFGEPEVEVTVKQATIPMEAAHFLTDYDNPEGQITLHVAHICAWNVAEWIRQYDVSAYSNHPPIAERIHGMDSSEMDISRLGHHVIDGEKGELVKSQVIRESPLTWGTGLYAYLDRLPSGVPPSRLEHIYWASFGLWPELMTEYGVRVFEDYKYRAFSISELLELAKNGIPSSLLCLDTTNMQIVDSYQAPRGSFVTSPQFIPRQNSQGGSTDGYLLCAAFTPENSEFWLFDGEHLSRGPLCKLSHPSLNFGCTLHTTWLPTIGTRQANYNIPVTLDYQAILNQQSDPIIQKLFNQKIYPNF